LEAIAVNTAKLFLNGQSQAVSLPKELRFEGTEVYIKKIGDAVVLFPKDKQWDVFLAGLSGFSDDFMQSGRELDEQDEQKDRESFDVLTL
jgi:antitoxin VapB